MKLTLFALTFVVLSASSTWAFGLGGNNGGGVRTCVIDLPRCRRRLNVCGRFGASNLCKRFTSLCDLQTANCQQRSQYSLVNASLCSGIAAGARGTCSSNAGVGGIVGGIGAGTGLATATAVATATAGSGLGGLGGLGGATGLVGGGTGLVGGGTGLVGGSGGLVGSTGLGAGNSNSVNGIINQLVGGRRRGGRGRNGRNRRRGRRNGRGRRGGVRVGPVIRVR